MNLRYKSTAVRSRIQIFAMILTSASILAVATARAGSESLKITDAWVPAVEKAGGDVPLVMTIHNESSPDALMRVRCAAANFSEKHTVDRGERAPAMRAIASIPL